LSFLEIILQTGNLTIFALAESIFMAAETVTPNAPATNAIFRQPQSGVQKVAHGATVGWLVP